MEDGSYASRRRKGRKQFLREKEKDNELNLKRSLDQVRDITEYALDEVKDSSYWIDDSQLALALRGCSHQNLLRAPGEGETFRRWRSLSDLDDVVITAGASNAGFKRRAEIDADPSVSEWMNAAPPYLRTDDNATIYHSECLMRFKSGDRLDATADKVLRPTIDRRIAVFRWFQQRWDGMVAVSRSVMLRQQVKDVRGASDRLIDQQVEQRHQAAGGFSIGLKSKTNPTFCQPVYGMEVPPSGKKGEKDGSTADDVVRRIDDTETYMHIAEVTLPPDAEGDFLYGKAGYQYYLEHKRHLDCLEKEQLMPQVFNLRRRLVKKKEQLETAVSNVRELYGNIYGRGEEGFQQRLTRLRQLFSISCHDEVLKRQPSRSAVMRAKLELVPVYTPWLTQLIVLIQIVAMALLCAYSGVVSPHFTHQRVVVKGIITWSGVQTVEHFIEPNIWAGPSVTKLISSGAAYAPCIRDDKDLLLRKAIYAAKPDELGCCEAKGAGAGTTTQSECNELQALFNKPMKWVNVSCSVRSTSILSGVIVPHEFKPCCLPSTGKCLLVSHRHCVIIGGIWHLNEHEHCSQAQCDSDLCQVYKHTDVHSNLTHYRNQFWRLPLSLFYHHGIIHVVINAVLQGIICIDLERVLGWFTFGLVYIICGLGGLIFGVTMLPLDPNTGCGGSISGLLAMRVLEHIQLWSLLQKDRNRCILWLTVLMAIVFGMGFLPGVNQFTNVFGALLGIQCYFVFMPDVANSRPCAQLILIMKVISVITLVVSLSVVTYTFYIVQPRVPQSAVYFNCLAFVDYACDQALP